MRHYMGWMPKYIAVGAVFLFLLPLAQDRASGWTTKVHTDVTETAIELISSDLFTRYSADLRRGSIEPDQNRVISHVDVQACVYMIDKIAKKCEEMIRNKEDWSKILFTMGQATHYIQDLNCPHHSIGRYIKGEHENFEAIATTGFWSKEKFDGFYYIKNYRIFGVNTSNWSERYFRFITSNLSQDDDVYKKLMFPLWDHTLHCTAHLWLTIMRNGLGEEGYKRLGLPEPVGIRDDQKIKFYRLKQLP